MPLTRFKLSAIADGGITTTELEDGTIIGVDVADEAISTQKMSGLTGSSSGIIKADGDGTMSVTTADLVDDTTPQLGGDLDGNGNTIDLTANTGYIGIPTGTTAQRPGSPSTGYTRMNTTTGSLEFYDGANWIATNLIPTIDSVSGTIYNTLATDLTLSVTNATDVISVVFKEGATTLATVSDQSVSSGSVTVTVPSAVYNQSVGDTITISITNQDGTPSSNSQNTTVASLPTGGSITTSGDYRIHTFSTSGTFTTSTALSDVEYLVIAGGGGGGTDNFAGDRGAGGGGAGGYRCSVTGETSGGGASAESKLSLSAASYTVTVGAGGAGATTAETGVTGTNGSNSVFSTITSIGGGGGQGHNSTGAYPGTAPTGGSGGGGSNSQSGGSGTSNQGYRGGNGATTPFNGGGGGGAGAQGQDATTSAAGNGGNGQSSNILGGGSTTRAGGGGGRGGSNNTTSGGSGGGGTGQNGGSGSVNTGSGGGAIRGTTAGAGGSGVVVVRYDVTQL